MNEQILTELITIRQLLERAIAAPPAARQAAPAPAGQVAIPQPSQLVADPGAVCVHFGKNAGQPLSALGDKSIEWYATPKEPRLGNNGKPFPPRPADEQLANAARVGEISAARVVASHARVSVVAPMDLERAESLAAVA